MRDLDIVGTGWSFPPRFDRQSGSVELRSGAEDIEESLRIIFSTRIGERLMQPKFGCDLSDQVFEPLNTGQLAYIQNLVETAILHHEPRIDAQVSVEPLEDLQSLLINVDYVIRGTNSRFNLVYPFHLQNDGSQLEGSAG